MTRLTGERGDIVLGWLTRLTATLAVVGVVGFDGISLLAARFQAADAAAGAARSAAAAYRETRDVQKAYDAAYAEVAADGDTVGTADFAVAADGAVTLTVNRTASTLVLEKVPPLRRFTTVRSTATGRPPG